MFFLYDDVLYLLVIPALLFVFSFKKRKNTLENVFSQAVIRQLTLHPQWLQASLRYRYFLLVISLMIIALARPVYLKQNALIQQMSSSAVIALDVSESMNASDIYPSRLVLAKEKLVKLIEKAEHLHVGVLLFAKNSYMLYPLSEDTQALVYMLKNAQIKQKFEPNTNLFGVFEASNKMLRTEKTKNIILLSDGGEDVTRVDETAYIRKNHLRLYVIDFASRSNNALKSMVKKSHGYYTKYQWGEDDIEKILNAIQKSSQKIIANAYDMKQYQELFMYPLGFALLILYFVFISGLKKKHTVTLAVLFGLMQLTFLNTSANAGVFDFITLQKAESFYAQKQYEQAIKYYKKLKPTNEVNYNIANALYKKREYLQAIKYYKKALGKDKLFNAKIYHNIGNCYVQSGKLERAKSQFEHSLQLHAFDETKKNLQIITQELKKRKKLKKIFSRGTAKVCFKNRLEQMNNEYKVSSKYKIKLQKLVLSEEEKWIKIIQKQKTPVFLQKIRTKRSSSDSKKPW
ncbi:VWA domain-containing protein [Sulfurimonas sp. SWIR-19]|uniref:vWA domain-containing protein n=1 Tax=Sulfurimonas sp. SWIR-19 TaxID=2878390 RepID=UPI001CF16284|nr:VWA domain-containing protein [Sulfurimonas sp. SWIR-19]UCM99362.1 VWA domain-containing protein [Sulfurimonas sp. SWIR-19]